MVSGLLASSFQRPWASAEDTVGHSGHFPLLLSHECTPASLPAATASISSPEGLLLLLEFTLPPITRPEVPENEGYSHTNSRWEVVSKSPSTLAWRGG